MTRPSPRGHRTLRRRVLLGVFMVSAQHLAAQEPLPAAAPATAAPSASAGAIVPPVAGVNPEFDARVKRIASRLRCPVCQGESIQDSPAELSAQMKTLVREQLANGRSEAEVLDYFLAKYGQWILLEPRAEGINLLVYWLPVLFLAFGAGGLWLVVRKWTRVSALPDGSTTPTAQGNDAVGMASE